MASSLHTPQTSFSTPSLNLHQYQSTTTDAVPSSKVAAFLDRVVTVSLIALCFGMPLFFVGVTFQGIGFEKQLYFYTWLLIAVVAWVSRGVIVGTLHLRRTPLDIPLAAFWCAIAVATYFSLDRWHSFWGSFGDPARGFLSITAGIIAYYIIVSHATRARTLLMLRATVFSGGVCALWIILAIMGTPFLPKDLQSFAPLSPVGTLGGATIFFGALLPLALGLAITSGADAADKSKARRLPTNATLMIALAGLFCVALLVLANYAIWHAIFAGTALFVVYIIAGIIPLAPSMRILPLALFFILFGIFLTGKSVVIGSARLPIEVAPKPSLSWEIARSALADHAFFGAGPALYDVVFAQYRPASYNDNTLFANMRFSTGAGFFFEMLPTTGIVGTLTGAFVVVTFLGVAFYLLSRRAEHQRTLSLGVTASVVVLIVAGATARMDGGLLIFGVLIASLAFTTLLEESGTTRSHYPLSFHAQPKFALALAFLFMVVSAGVVYTFVFIGKVFAADAIMGSAVRSAQISEDRSLKKIASAIRLYPYEGLYYTRAGQEYLVLANNEGLKKREERDEKKIAVLLDQSIQSSFRGQKMMPHSITTVVALAQVYENASLYIDDALEQSRKMYERAAELEPTNPNYWAKLSQIDMRAASLTKDELAQKKFWESAQKHAQKAVDIFARFAPGHYQLALAYDKLGDRDAAIVSAEKAVGFAPRDVTAIFTLAQFYQQRGGDEDQRRAKVLFKRILGVNDKEINAHFALAQLYDKTNRSGDAREQYRKVMELLPDDVTAEVRQRIQNLIDGVAESETNVSVAAPSPAPEQPTLPVVDGAPMPANPSTGDLPEDDITKNPIPSQDEAIKPENP